MVETQLHLENDSILVTDWKRLFGKTISGIVESKGGTLKVLHISFSDGSYCVILSDDPRLGVHLMDDTERVIPTE